MSITRVGGSDRYVELFNGTGPVTVTKDTGTAANDLGLMFVSWYQDNSPYNINTPSGWSKIGSDDSLVDFGSGASLSTTFQRTMTGSEGSGFDVSFPDTSYCNVVLLTLRASGALSVEVKSAGTPVEDSTTVTAPSVSGQTNDMLISGMFISDPTTFTTPGGMTVGPFNPSATTNMVKIFYETLLSTGSTGTRSSTLGTARDTIGISYIIREAVTSSNIVAWLTA